MRCAAAPTGTIGWTALETTLRYTPPARCVRTRAPPGSTFLGPGPIPLTESCTRTMFDTLSDRLRKTLGTLTGRGRISEADVDAAMREVRLALLEADVNFKVVKDFVARVRERAIGHEVLESLSAGQQVVKIVNDELVALLSAGDRTFHLSGNPGRRRDGRPAGLRQDDLDRQARPPRGQARPPAPARGGGPVPPGRRRPARDARQEPGHPRLSRAGRDPRRRHRARWRRGRQAPGPRRRHPRHRRAPVR